MSRRLCCASFNNFSVISVTSMLWSISLLFVKYKLFINQDSVIKLSSINFVLHLETYTVLVYGFEVLLNRFMTVRFNVVAI